MRRRIGDDLAGDLTGEVFERAFRDRSRFDVRYESALPWLLGIATNVVKMNRRSEQRRLRAYARVARRDVEPASSSEIDARVDAVALGPVLAEALAAMPSGQRDVLLLHAWGDLQPAEIAVALGVSAGTVRSRLSRARVFVEARLARGELGAVLDEETI